MRNGAWWLAIVVSTLGAAAGGCETTSIAVKEKFGYAKREQLADKVQSASDGQVEAKKQFESALAEFLAVTGTKGSAKTADLEAKYEKLKKEYERSESKAGAVHDRIAGVEAVADALFKEWREELKQYSSDSLRRSSENELNRTRQGYDRLLGAMKSAESKMAPVLGAFKDQVLYLKHNLNARAIASLQDTADSMQRDVGGLIREMDASIAEARSFIDQMKASNS